jgi:hypothetical protein
MWYRLLVHWFQCAGPTSLILKIANSGSMLIITIASMMVFVRKKFDVQESSTIMECAALCIMMNLFSPIAWIHHFVFLYPAVATAWWGYLKDPSFINKRLYQYGFFFWAAIVLVPYVFAKIIGPVFQACSNYTVAALLLLLLLLRMISQYGTIKNSGAV